MRLYFELGRTLLNTGEARDAVDETLGEGQSLEYANVLLVLWPLIASIGKKQSIHDLEIHELVELTKYEVKEVQGIAEMMAEIAHAASLVDWKPLASVAKAMKEEEEARAAAAAREAARIAEEEAAAALDLAAEDAARELQEPNPNHNRNPAACLLTLTLRKYFLTIPNPKPNPKPNCRKQGKLLPEQTKRRQKRWKQRQTLLQQN